MVNLRSKNQPEPATFNVRAIGLASDYLGISQAVLGQGSHHLGIVGQLGFGI
jgi:hypothetical protein